MRFKREAHLQDSNALVSAELIIQDIQAHCSSLKRIHSYYEIGFGGSVAYVKAEQEHMWIRVEAEELAICYGTKMLMQSQISQHLANMPECLLWVDADETPFTAIISHVRHSG